MTTFRTHLTRSLAALAAGAMLLGACGSDSTSSTTAPAGSGAPTASGAPATPTKVVVGAADFPESQLLAEIYTLALQRAGVDATSTDPLGSRELYYPAIRDGEIDLLPEYTNALLTFVRAQGGDQPTEAPSSPMTIDDQVAALREILPSALTVTAASSAEDKDVIVCRADVADRLGIANLSDLAAHAGEITLGAPPEFETRTPFGVKGFHDVLGATFKAFIPLKIAQVADSLSAGVIDCGNLFSTMSVITTAGFVALDDDQTLVPHEAVVPLIATRVAAPEVTAVLDDVSARLDTPALTALMVRIEVDKLGFDVVAKEFLDSL